LLPNKNRLKRSAEIKATLRKRQYTTRTPLLHIVAVDSQKKGFRLAVTIKGVKSAVKRNRLKRLIKAAMLINGDKIGKNIDVVVFPKEDLLTEKADNIANMIMKTIEKWPK
jgi:ribonuclease P protein component